MTQTAITLFLQYFLLSIYGNSITPEVYSGMNLNPREQDSLALIALYDSTNGQEWATTWQIRDTPMSQWYGVSLTNGRVTSLDLDSNELKGQLPSLITNLTELKNLNLYFNQLTGPIPENIGNMTKLEFLSLWDNQLTGPIPESIGELPNILDISLGNNKLKGIIPSSIGNLSTLNWLSLVNNDLGPTIPESLGNLRNLTGLYISTCNIEGSLPEFISQLTSLQYLSLADNKLTGEIPASYSQLTDLRYFYLFLNQLEGQLPEFIVNFPFLEGIYFFDNQFEGCFPESYSRFCNLNFSSILEQPGYDFTNNPLLSWSGDFSSFCSQGNQRSGDCNDGNPLTTKDQYQDDCSCQGIICNVIETIFQEEICEGEPFLFQNENLTETGIYRYPLLSQIGCDSIIILELNVKSTNTLNISRQICEGESFSFNEQELDQAGFYQQVFTNQNGCDSIVSLELVVNSKDQRSINRQVCEGESFFFGDLQLTQAGTYEQTFTNQSGCDSIISLELVVNSNSQSFIERQVCEGESFFFAGQELNQSGNYQEFLTNQNGCDSIVSLELVINNTDQTFVDRQICEGESIFFDGQERSQAGFYQQVLTNQNGCDSIITLELVVNSTDQRFINRQICEGESFIFMGQELRAPGTYQGIFSNQNSCDSIVILELVVNNIDQIFINRQICEGESFLFGGQELIEPGTYQDVLTNNNGCDSVVSLELMVNNIDRISISRQICEGASFLFGEQELKEAGTYQVIFSNQNGCDSLVLLELIVNNISELFINRQICEGESFFFNGQELNQSGNYQEFFTNNNGCDSIVSLELMVNNTDLISINRQICEGESFFFGGQELIESGTYQDTFTNKNGCDSIISLELIVNNIKENFINWQICEGESFFFGEQQLNQTGRYQQIFSTKSGCDSIVSLELQVDRTIIQTIDTTVCNEDQFFFGGISITSPGIYYDSLTTNNGCDSVIELVLQHEQPKSIFLVEDTILIEKLGEVSFQPFRNDSFPNRATLNIFGEVNSLLDQDTTISIFIDDAQLLPYEIPYDLCVNTSCQTICSSSKIVVNFRNCIEGLRSSIPKAFSPNSRIQENRFFDPLAILNQGSCTQISASNTTLSIMTRWGDIVYKRKPYEAWDGTNNGSILPQGTYYYILQYGSKKNEIIKGSIKLVFLKN